MELDNGHSSMFVRVQLDERESTISLHADLREISDGLEQRDKVCLGAIGDEIANVDCRVVRRSLLDDGLVREGTPQEIHRSRRSSTTTTAAQRRASGGRRGTSLSLLIGPVNTNGTRPEPFAIHSSDGLLGVGLVTESKETIATRLPRVHVPHDTSIGQSTKSGKRLSKDIIVYLRGEVADENMVVVGSVLLVLLTLVRPIDADLGVKDLAAVEGLKSGLRGAHVHVLDEAIVQATVLVVTVWDDLDMLDWTGYGKYLREHVLGHPWAQVAHV